MATITTKQAPVLPAPSGWAGFGGTLRSELTKIGSVRSTVWTLLVLFAVSVGIGAVASRVSATGWLNTAPADRTPLDATQVSLVGLLVLGPLVIVVLRALVLSAALPGLEGTLTPLWAISPVMPRAASSSRVFLQVVARRRGGR